MLQGQGAEASNILIHPGWDRSSKLNDILAGHDLSIITLKEEVDMYNIKTIPICLPDPGRDNFLTRSGRAADVTGFGLIVNPRTGGRKNPDFVQTASVTVVEPSTCKDLWNISGSQICAVGNQNIVVQNTNKEIVSDSCNGDSGGGLTSTNVQGREVILGIVSFGEADCGRIGGKPGVYTNVMDHFDWINSNIQDKKKEVTTESTNEEIIDIGSESKSEFTRTSNDSAGLNCLASNGKVCRFPFKFQGKVFPSCTTDFDPDKRPWCSTKGKKLSS